MNVTKSIAWAAMVAVVGVSSSLWAADYNKTDPSANPGTPSGTTGPSAVPGSPAGTDAAYPDSSERSNPGAMDNQAAMNTLTGVVQKVDKSNKSVQLQDSNGVSQTLKIGKSTEITRNGAAVQLAQVKKGDTITVRNSNPAM